MVNTFLISSDFDKNAQLLDNARLGKQRVEAYQILDLCKSLHILAKLYNNPLPNDPYEYYDWIRQIAKRFKQDGVYYVERDEKIYSVTKKPKMRKLRAGEEILSIDSEFVTIQSIKNKRKSKIPSNLFVNRYEVYITLGFVYHPAVAMWLGHEDALRAYINSCIKEWIMRGNSNTMKMYSIPENYQIPPWVSDSYLHENHKSNLLTKEIERNESAWYIKLFPHVKTHVEYFWPYSINYDFNKRYQNNIIITNNFISLSKDIIKQICP